VPGHEKFIKTMVAGVNTVDLALLVIAADDGVMPQTTEHLEILNLLQIPSGIIAVSKTDLVEKDWVDLVIEDIKKLVKGTTLEGSPILPVSPITGEGIETLRETIFQVAGNAQARRDKGIFRLPIDRVFTIKGFGTVVAGTVLSGKVKQDDTVELLPKGMSLRVRGVQVHKGKVQEGSVGYRTAINLLGIEKEAVQRGDVLAEPGFFKPTSMIDTRFSLLSSWKKDLKNRTRVHVHIGTSEVIARMILLDKEIISPGEECYVQFHFEKPVIADQGDRYVVRSYSPVRTLGGGVILDVHPHKHKRFQKDIIERLEKLLKGDLEIAVLEILKDAWFTPMTVEDLAKSLGITKENAQNHLDKLSQSGETLQASKKGWMAADNHEILKRKLLSILDNFHKENPLRVSMPTAELRSRIRQPLDKILFEKSLGSLQEEKKVIIQKDRVQMSGHKPSMTPEQEKIKKKIENKFLQNPFSPPGIKEIIESFGKSAENLVSHLMETGELIRLDEGILLHRKALEEAKEKIGSFLAEKGPATVSEIREHLGTTRKYAVPLLTYLDNIGFTARNGDHRKLKNRPN
jgi:selenocysteine-specific elongation factor